MPSIVLGKTAVDVRFLKTLLQAKEQNPTDSAVSRTLRIVSAETVSFQFPTKRTVADTKFPNGEVAIGIGVTCLRGAEREC
jgi:hypothetical protein